MNIKAEDVMKKLDEYLETVTLEQLNRDLEKAGAGFYALDAYSSSLSSVGLEGLLSLANELEIEGKFLDNPHDSEVDRASGRTFKECAERIRDFIEKTEAD